MLNITDEMLEMIKVRIDAQDEIYDNEIINNSSMHINRLSNAGIPFPASDSWYYEQYVGLLSDYAYFDITKQTPSEWKLNQMQESINEMSINVAVDGDLNDS